MSMQELLAKLKKDYLNEFPSKISEINQLFNQQDWTNLQDSFHKLKGSGKTYGVPEVSDVCLILEKSCESCPQELRPLIPDSLKLLDKIAKSHLEEKAVDLSADATYLKLKELKY